MQYDELVIFFKRVGSTEEDRYQTSIWGPPVQLMGGPMPIPEHIPSSEIEAIRTAYTKAINQAHAKSQKGFPSAAPSGDTLVTLGKRIAQMLPQPIKISIQRTLRYARSRKRGLRIVLRVDPDAKALLSIPWELLALPVLPLEQHAEDLGPAICVLLYADVSLVRQVQDLGRSAALAFPEAPILEAFAATPDGKPIEDLERMAALLEARHGKIQTHWYHGPDTLSAIQRRLLQSSANIVYIISHGEAVETLKGTVYHLLFTHADGFPRRVSAFELAPALSLAPQLQLVVLQICESASPQLEQANQAGESVALGLIRHGVPMVVAMQGEFATKESLRFMDALCNALSNNKSVEEGVTEGRLAMQEAGSADWSLPVIYQGSTPTSADEWYNRVADHIDVWVDTPKYRHALRNTAMVVAGLLIVMSLANLLILPSIPTLLVWHEVGQVLMAWTIFGLVVPGIIALLYRSVLQQPRLPSTLKRKVLMTQWTGAYMGYGVGGILGWTVLGLSYGIGMLSRLGRESQLGVVLVSAGLIIAWSGLISYVSTRRMAESAVVLGEKHDDLFNLRSQMIFGFGGLIILSAPLAAYLGGEALFGPLMHPISSSLLVAAALLYGIHELAG